MSHITVRLAIEDDLVTISNLLARNSGCWANRDATTTYYDSILTLLATDDCGQPTGLLSIAAGPGCLGSAPEGATDWLEKEVKDLGYSNSSSACISGLFLPADNEVHTMRLLLRHAFVHLGPTITDLLLAAGQELASLSEGVLAWLVTLSSQKDLGMWLYHCHRAQVLPPLKVRPSKVEDHDDLLPIWVQGVRRQPALATLPKAYRPEEPYTLVKVLSTQTEENVTLVAEAEGKLVGMLVATTEVELGVLQESFDLHSYKGLLLPEMYQKEYQEACRKKLNLQDSTPDNLGHIPPETSQNTTSPHHTSQASESEGVPVAAEFSLEPACSDTGEGDGTSPEDSTEEDIREELLNSLAGQDLHCLSRVVAVTLMCMIEEYEGQGEELLAAALERFPNKDYCIVTLPPSSLEPTWMKCMTHVKPLPGGVFPHELYILHQEGLASNWEVRAAEPEDMPLVQSLLVGSPHGEQLQDSFLQGLSSSTSFIALVTGTVVGLCVVTPEVNTNLLEANFRLLSALGQGYRGHGVAAEIESFMISPHFSHRSSLFLAGVMSSMKKRVLHYALLPEVPAPDFLGCLQQIPPRHSPVPRGLQGDFALYSICRHMTFRGRTTFNHRVVIVGASECGLSVLEHLLTAPDVSFTSLTLLAPEGISVGGVASHYTASIIAKLGLEARVRLLAAALVGILRGQKMVLLDDGTEVPYDLLLLCTGAQDVSSLLVKDRAPEVVQRVVPAHKVISEFSESDVELLQDIVVYGGGLSAYQVMTFLMAKGVSHEKITFVMPSVKGGDAGDVLRDISARINASLPEPHVMTLIDTQVADDGGQLMCTFLKEGERVQQACDLLVSCGVPDVSPQMVDLLNNSGLVYDGRLVVDQFYCTNDPAILAGGPLAKFTRRLGPDLGGRHLGDYCSAEVGERMSSAVLTLVSCPPCEHVPPLLPHLLNLHQGKLVGCRVPGGNAFLLSGTEGLFRGVRNSCYEGPGGEGTKVVVSHKEEAYCALTIKADVVESLEYLGPNLQDAVRLARLVGLRGSYVGDLAVPADRDPLTYLHEEQCSLLCHEDFSAVRCHIVLRAHGGQLDTSHANRLIRGFKHSGSESTNTGTSSRGRPIIDI